MEIVKYELTQEIALKITEFCDIGDEQSMRETWDAEIEQLKNAIGAKG